MTTPVATCILLAALAALAGCAGPAAVNTRGSANPSSCPIAAAQGNGGAPDRCGQIPPGCICQQM